MLFCEDGTRAHEGMVACASRNLPFTRCASDTPVHTPVALSEVASLRATQVGLGHHGFACALDEAGAAELMRKAELHRLGEITQSRRERALADARAAEVVIALEVLRDLEAQLEPVEREAAAAADALTAALIHPAALSNDNEFSHYRDTGRTTVETFMHGTYPAKVLRERIIAMQSTSWGSNHIPRETAVIAASYDADVLAIKAGTATLKAALKAVQKISP